jgi:hypothetical protein
MISRWILLLTLLVASHAVLAETDADEFCVRAQKLIASTSLEAINTIHVDYQAYVKSKPHEDPLSTEQYYYYGEDGVAQIVSCKMKSAGRIIMAHGEQAAGAPQDCRRINQQSFNEVYAVLEAHRQKLRFTRSDVVFEDDDSAYMGPRWLEPWPYPVATVEEDGKLHIRAKAMNIPFAWYIPMPDRFKGVHYCHLAAPAYLRQLLVK